MYRTILLSYDGTRESREALRQGAELARTTSAAVHLLAIVTPERGEPLVEGGSSSGLTELEREEVHRVLDEGATQLRSGGLRVQVHLAHGNAAEEIGRVAREVGADLLVVGHREQGRLSRWWRGSVGASLLTHAPCSILVAVSHPEEG